MSISLTVQWTASQDLQSSKFKLSGLVTGNTDIRKEIFLHQRDVNVGTDSYYSVATPAQLVDYPADEPVPGSVFYLKDNFEIEFDEAGTMMLDLGRMKQDVQNLVNDWDTVGGQINNTETLVYVPEE
jgi:hypothetical protein